MHKTYSTALSTLNFCAFFTVFWTTTIKNPVVLPFHSERIQPPPKAKTPCGSCDASSKTPSTLCGHMTCNVSTKAIPKTKAEPKNKG